MSLNDKKYRSKATFLKKCCNKNNKMIYIN